MSKRLSSIWMNNNKINLCVIYHVRDMHQAKNISKLHQTIANTHPSEGHTASLGPVKTLKKREDHA